MKYIRAGMHREASLLGPSAVRTRPKIVVHKNPQRLHARRIPLALWRHCGRASVARDREAKRIPRSAMTGITLLGPERGHCCLAQDHFALPSSRRQVRLRPAARVVRYECRRSSTSKFVEPSVMQVIARHRRRDVAANIEHHDLRLSPLGGHVVCHDRCRSGHVGDRFRRRFRS